jgi:hypothetical protein
MPISTISGKIRYCAEALFQKNRQVILPIPSRWSHWPPDIECRVTIPSKIPRGVISSPVVACKAMPVFVAFATFSHFDSRKVSYITNARREAPELRG